MTSPPRAETFTPRQGRFDVTLAIILFLAAALRFYNLGLPTLWQDELECGIAFTKLSWPELFAYVHKYSLVLHYNLFVIKFASILGTEEWVLRFPAALIGTFGVFLCYRLGKDIGCRNAGHIAALLAAINLLLICYSRFAWLTYAFFFCLSAWSCVLFFETLTTRFKSGSIHLALVNSAAMLIYEGSFVFSAIEAMLLGIFLVIRWKECSLKYAIIHYGILAIPALAVMYRLIPLVGSGYANTQPGNNPNIFHELPVILETILEAFSPNASLNVLTVALSAFFLFGVYLLSKKSKIETIMSLSIIIFPAIAMQLAANNIFTGPDRYHRIAYALPLIFALTGVGISYIIPHTLRILVPLTGVASALYIFSAYSVELYSERSNISLWLPSAYFRQVANSLSALAKPNGALIFSDHLYRHRLDWYLAKNTENDIRIQAIPPGEGNLVVSLVSSGELPFGQPSGGADEMRREFTRTVGVHLEPYSTFYSTVIRRSPIRGSDSSALPIEFSFDGFKHFCRVYAQNKIFMSPYWGGQLYPADTSDDCWFIYKIIFDKQKVQEIFGNITYTNELKGNVIEVSLSSDGEHFQPAHFGRQVGTRIIERFNLELPESTSDLFIRVKLKAQRWPPDLYLDNAKLLRIENIKLYSCDRDNAAKCDILNIISSSPGNTNVVQLPQTPEASYENFADVPTHEIPGWRCIGAADADIPGRVKVSVTKHGTLSLYPRVGSQTDTVKVINADTGQQLLFLAGIENKFTPLGMRYDLPLKAVPDGQVLNFDITVTGKAQLWLKENSIIVTPAPEGLVEPSLHNASSSAEYWTQVLRRFVIGASSK